MADQILCTPDQVSAIWPAFASMSPTLQNMLINTASQACLNFCNQTFEQITEDEYKDGNNTGILWLNNLPVVVVNTITIQNGGLVLDNADGRDWTLYPKNGKLVRGPGLNDERFAWFFPKGNRNIVVNYTGGYAAIPDAVVMAACLYTRYYFGLTRNSGIYQSESIGDYSYTLGPMTAVGGLTTMGVPTYIADLLSPYVLDMGPR
jgi:hypothetical protein